MLHDFLKTHRSELIDRCREMAARRSPQASATQRGHGVPLFLDQLTEMLAHSGHDRPWPGLPAEAASDAESRIAHGATLRGQELRQYDFTIEQVVHEYGDLCQAITQLAAERREPVTVEEFGELNIRLDKAIASAVTEFARPREAPPTTGALDMNQRLGYLAHEMRNMLNTTILAITAIRMGSVGFGGATAGALDRSLIGMRTLIDRTLAEVRLEGGGPPLRERLEIGPFIAEVRVAAALEARQKGCALTVPEIATGLFVQADRFILASAVSNLLQNAFKFTRPESHVVLKAHASKGRVLIEVADECGGMPEGAEKQIFRPFEQRGPDRSGLGLGLALSRRGIESLGGVLSVRNFPGKGCVFAIDLPLEA